MLGGTSSRTLRRPYPRGPCTGSMPNIPAGVREGLLLLARQLARAARARHPRAVRADRPSAPLPEVVDRSRPPRSWAAGPAFLLALVVEDSRHAGGGTDARHDAPNGVDHCVSSGLAPSSTRSTTTPALSFVRVHAARRLDRHAGLRRSSGRRASRVLRPVDAVGSGRRYPALRVGCARTWADYVGGLVTGYSSISAILMSRVSRGIPYNRSAADAELHHRCADPPEPFLRVIPACVSARRGWHFSPMIAVSCCSCFRGSSVQRSTLTATWRELPECDDRDASMHGARCCGGAIFLALAQGPIAVVSSPTPRSPQRLRRHRITTAQHRRGLRALAGAGFIVGR